MWGSFALIRNYRLAWIKSSNTDTAFKHWCLVDQFLPSSTDPLHVELRATSHTHMRDWEPVTSTLQALSLVEKAEPVQPCFTLRLRDQRSTWMQDGCQVYMDSYMASNGSCFMFHGQMDYFQKPHLGGRPNTKPWHHDTMKSHNR